MRMLIPPSTTDIQSDYRLPETLCLPSKRHLILLGGWKEMTRRKMLLFECHCITNHFCSSSWCNSNLRRSGRLNGSVNTASKYSAVHTCALKSVVCRITYNIANGVRSGLS